MAPPAAGAQAPTPTGERSPAAQGLYEPQGRDTLVHATLSGGCCGWGVINKFGEPKKRVCVSGARAIVSACSASPRVSVCVNVCVCVLMSWTSP